MGFHHSRVLSFFGCKWPGWPSNCSLNHRYSIIYIYIMPECIAVFRRTRWVWLRQAPNHDFALYSRFRKVICAMPRTNSTESSQEFLRIMQAPAGIFFLHVTIRKR